MTKEEIEKLFREPKRLFIAVRAIQLNLISRKIGPRWKDFIATKDWQEQIAPLLTQDQRDRFELEWQRSLSSS